ncbi:MAG: CPBP family intramembrane metalloprotease [Candidatus Eremiobacteraeota bacterium]|nr:CPBP family intramembrane metalloprotease [Candidatus Eremiobacteraeota bacterium]
MTRIENVRGIFIGESGLRPWWRFAAFFALAYVCLDQTDRYVTPWLLNALRVEPTLNAPLLIVSESVQLVVVVALTAVFAAFERRRIDRYGLPVERAFRSEFWDGTLAGIVVIALVGAAMLAGGGFVIHGLGNALPRLLGSALMWLVAMVLVGFSEELLFRGYLLDSLRRSVGFWPAAIVTSLIFGAAHINKPGENFIDIFNIIVIGFFVCFTILRTGSLWWAIGFHMAFDYMQIFAIGTPNGSARPVDTLWNATFPGPAWLNGGVLGTEASYLMLPAIALLFVYVQRRYPGDRAQLPIDRGSGEAETFERAGG